MSSQNLLTPKYILQDCTRLLSDDITYTGWEGGTANKKAFYLRGYTWYKLNVLNKTQINITDSKVFIPRAMEIIAQRNKEWNSSIDFTERFAASQLHYAVSATRRKPIMFSKAVQALAVLEAMAESLAGFDPLEIYSRMRIEPAVSYIHDFTEITIETLKSADGTFFDKLRSTTAQPSNAVFRDMASQRTVTHKLAQAVRSFIKTNYPFVDVGEVDFRPTGKVIFRPSDAEQVG